MKRFAIHWGLRRECFFADMDTGETIGIGSFAVRERSIEVDTYSSDPVPQAVKPRVRVRTEVGGLVKTTFRLPRGQVEIIWDR